MENLNNDLNFSSNEIDPNQLGFSAEASYNSPSASASSQSTFRGVDTRENQQLNPDENLANAENTHNQQLYAQGLLDYQGGLQGANMGIALEADSINAFLASSALSQSQQQVNSFPRTDGLAPDNPAVTLPHTMDITGQSDLTHLYSNLTRDEKATQQQLAYMSFTPAVSSESHFDATMQQQPGTSFSDSQQVLPNASLPSLAGLLPFPGKASTSSNPVMLTPSTSYSEPTHYNQQLSFQQPSPRQNFLSDSQLQELGDNSVEFYPVASSSELSVPSSIASSRSQQSNPRLSLTSLSQLLLSLPQNSELYTQLSTQLQNQGLSLPHISSVLTSLVSKSLAETPTTPRPQVSTPQQMAPPPPQPRGGASDSDHEVKQPTSLQESSCPSSSSGDRVKNEPEMMIYHDKMTRKNILVPIGPPNVGAGRNMAPSPMFLDDNPSTLGRRAHPQVTEASSSDQVRPINVSDFLNLPSRTPREATPAPSHSSNHRTADSPPDNLVSSTTQDIREDLPPLREILNRQQNYGDISSIDISGIDSSSSQMASRSRDFHAANLLSSSFHGEGSGNDVMFEQGEASGMLSLPEYEPISDSEEGEISTTCVMTPRPNYIQNEEEEDESNGEEDESSDNGEEVKPNMLPPKMSDSTLYQQMLSQQRPHLHDLMSLPQPIASTSVSPSSFKKADAHLMPPPPNDPSPALEQPASLEAPPSGNAYKILGDIGDQSKDLHSLSPVPYPTDESSAEGILDKDSIPQELSSSQEEDCRLKEEVSSSDPGRHLVDDSQLVEVDGQKKWVCLECPKKYSSKHNLLNHVLSHQGIRPHCCLLCGKFFQQQSHLHTHMLTHGKVKPHSCPVCQRSFTQASHMKRHMAVHMERRPHICNICDRGFIYPSELKIHMANHRNGKAYVCAECGESFTALKKLRTHTSREHKDLSGLACHDCGKSFTYPSQLKDHMLKHEGKRPFICGECGMDFMKEHHLKAHAFTHTGLKPFTCPECKRAFNQKANLLRHMVVHDEQRKFECDICKRCFTQAQVLRAHMVTHAEKKPHTCKVCGKGFSRLHNLNGHMHMHSGDKPHVCFCGASFTLKGNLNRHKKEKHNLGSEVPTEEEAAHILNEMSAGRRASEVGSSENTDEDGSSPKKKRKSLPRKNMKGSSDQEGSAGDQPNGNPIEETSTTDLSSIDLISKYVSLGADCGATSTIRLPTTLPTANSVDQMTQAPESVTTYLNIAPLPAAIAASPSSSVPSDASMKLHDSKKVVKSEESQLNVQLSDQSLVSLPAPIVITNLTNVEFSAFAPSSSANAAKPKTDIVLPPKRRVSEIEKEAGLL